MSIQLFKKWTQAVVNSDWDSMSSLYAEDIVKLNPDGSSNVGKEECLQKDKGWDSAFSDFKFDVVNSMESGNTTVMEVQITCTMTGEMMNPDGSKIPPTGKTLPLKVISPVIAIFFFTNLLVKRETKDVNIVIPAEGPSLGVAPSGT